MDAVETYRDLLAWQRAMDFAEAVYRLTASLPREEIYGLSSQLQRSAVSVASNIAEGHDRRSSGDYVRFLGMARGSLAEAETQLLLAVRLGYIREASVEGPWAIAQETGRLIMGLIRGIERRR